MGEMVTAEASHRFATLRPEAVYDAWTDAAVARRWMDIHLKQSHPDEVVTKVEIDPRIGGRFAFADTREESDVWGFYRELDRPGRVVFSWFVTPEEEAEDRSLVSIDIVADGAGCVATVQHAMGAEWADYVDRTAKAWASMLEAIDMSLSR